MTISGIEMFAAICEDMMGFVSNVEMLNGTIIRLQFNAGAGLLVYLTDANEYTHVRCSQINMAQRMATIEDVALEILAP